MKPLLILSLTFLLFSFPPSAYAGKIQIVDSDGLTRAATNTTGTTQVVVTLRGKGDKKSATLTLSNIDGIASDIQGVTQPSGNIIFRGVSAGRWKIMVKGKGVKVGEVKILDRS